MLTYDLTDVATTSQAAAAAATSQSASPAITTTPQPSGAATSKRDRGGDWKLAAGRRVVNGITYWSPTRWNQNRIRRVV